MSFRSAVDALYAAVVATSRGEQPDIPFRAVEDPSSGLAVPIDELTGDVTRAVDLRMESPPVDDGGSGWPYQRFVVAMRLRVRYPTEPRSMVEMMIGDDVPRLVNTLVHPSSWTPGVIDTVEPPGAPTLDPVDNADGETVALILSIPFRLHYRA